MPAATMSAIDGVCTSQVEATCIITCDVPVRLMAFLLGAYPIPRSVGPI